MFEYKFRDLARIFRNKKTACPISVHEGAPGQELISTSKGSARSSELRLQLYSCQSASPEKRGAWQRPGTRRRFDRRRRTMGFIAARP